MVNVVNNVADVLELEQTSKIFFTERLRNEFVRISQFLTWPILSILFRSVFEIRISGQEVFRNARSPFIIIANHTSFYDSFLFRLALGLWTPHLPLRFMAVTKFEKSFLNFFASMGIIDFVYSLFGVFTVTPGLGIDKNIEKAKKIISNNGNIVIYPEGRIADNGHVEPFKKGAAVLYKQTGVNVIPVSFRRCKCKIFRKIIFINVGKAISISRNRSVEDITDQYHRIVSELYGKGTR